MDEVARALGEVYRLLEAELHQTVLYGLIQDCDRWIEHNWRATQHVNSLRDLQGKLRLQLRETPQALMMDTLATLIEKRASMAKVEVDPMDGVTVLDEETHSAIQRWENEGGAAQ